MSIAMDFIPFVSELKGVIECLAEGDIACAVAEAMPGPSSRKVSKSSEAVEDAVSSAVTKKPGAMVGKRLGHTLTKHGAENTDQLKEAKGSGRPVGQWLDNDAAEHFIAERLDDLKNGAKTFDLPPGLGRIIHPDGTFTVATKARLVPSGSGVKTAYPSLE